MTLSAENPRAHQSPSAAGRTIVVAGAGGAAGRAVCAALTEAGARVIALSSRAGSLTHIAAAETVAIDAADAEQVATWAESLRDAGTHVDGLIHLVGGWRPGVSDDDWQWLERRVLTTLRVLSRELRDDLSESSEGRLAIVSAASLAAPRWGMANYVALKAAAEAWVQALANGWRVKGTPTAAVTFVAEQLDVAVIDRLAAACVGLWTVPHAELNGAVLDLRESVS